MIHGDYSDLAKYFWAAIGLAGVIAAGVSWLVWKLGEFIVRVVSKLF